MEKDNVTIEVWVETDLVGSLVSTTVEINRDEWEHMPILDREQRMREEMLGMIEWGWKEKDADS